VEVLATAIVFIKMGLLNGLPVEADEIDPLFIEMASILIFLNYVILKQLLNFQHFCQPIHHHVGVFRKAPKLVYYHANRWTPTGICMVCRISPLKRH
jgi:uncharacterized membrane protein YkgB